MTGVVIGLLGPFRLHAADGTPVDAGGHRVRMLLARLALDAGRTVSGDVLIDELWGADRPSATLNTLQSLVSRARRALLAVDGVALESGGGGYRLTVLADRVDVHRFERLTAAGSRHLASGDAEAASRDLHEALSLWRGEALVDFAGAAFAETHRARFDERRNTALEGRIDADLRLGRHRDVLPELDALVLSHPLRERFTALRMRALCGAGRQADALAAYEDLRRRLSAELGVDPSLELRELHVAVLRGTPEPHVSSTPDVARSAEPPLPVRTSSFVGREREIGEVAAALRGSRLVTLFGPGGAGKTRLATESAAGTGARTDDAASRVVFVELAPVRDGFDLPSAVMAGLGSREARLLEVQPAARQAVERLVDVLCSEPTLLVLDNCEHVIDAAARLVDDLLSRCPDLRVLTTSREPLALTGEALLPVGPLALPDGEQDGRNAPAVRLFAERARAVRPAFALDATTLGAVVEICRGLDGMPLAIELAAARLRSMSVRQVAERLDDRFRLLTGGNRTSMPRHRTLRAVVEWSWELLDDAERQLAAGFAVFTGSVRAESVAAVCADGGREDDVVYVLSSLVEKSLVEAVDGDAGMRYRMLETVRAYCAERLDEFGGRGELGARHAGHFLEFAETASARLHGPGQLTWLRRLDGEHDNVLTAMHRCTGSADADRATRFAAALGWYWAATAQHGEVLARLSEVADVPGDAPESARALVELMRVFFSQDPEWTEQLRRAAGRVRDSGAMSRYPYAAMFEPVAWMLAGDFAEMDDAVRRAKALPGPWEHAGGLYAQAVGAEHRGDLPAAERYARAAVKEFGEIGDRWGYAQATGMLAGLLSTGGDHAGAIEVLSESVASIRELGSSEDLVPQLGRVGLEKVRAGDLDGAREVLEEAAATVTRSQPYHRVTVACGFAEVARHSGDLAGAREHLQRAHEAVGRPERVPQPMRQLVLAFEARLLVDEAGPGGRLTRARECLTTAVEVGRSVGDMPLTAMLADQVARVLFVEGEPERAARMLGAGTVMRGVLDEGDPDVRALRADLDAALGAATHAKHFDDGAALDRGAAHAELIRVLRA